MGRIRIVKDLSTGELVVVPYTAQEEAEADAVFAADELAQAPIRAEAARAVAFKADAARTALIAKLKTATPAQIDTYFAGRTTVAQIKADVVDIVKVLALAIRD